MGCWWRLPRYGKALETGPYRVDGRPEPGPSERPDVRHWPGPPQVAHVGTGPPFGAALLQHHLSLTWEGHGPQLWPLSTAYPRYRGTIRRGRCSGWGPSPASCCTVSLARHRTRALWRARAGGSRAPLGEGPLLLCDVCAFRQQSEICREETSPPAGSAAGGPGTFRPVTGLRGD